MTKSKLITVSNTDKKEDIEAAKGTGRLCIHCKKGQYIIRETLGNMLKHLAPHGSVRCQLRASDSIAKMLRKNELDNREKRPLLPLNLGQIGLIGGSGLINGLVDCDAPHIIKGRVVKETVRSHGQGTDEGTLTETRTNRMVFNILTPGGLRSLA